MKQIQTTPISIIIADDHVVVRRSLRTLIASAPDMILLGEAGTCQDVIAMVTATPPSVVLLDVQMLDGNGIDAAKVIHLICPKVVLIILTIVSDDAQLYAALQVGVKGYLLKDISGEALLQAIRDAAHGKLQLHPAITQRLVQLMQPPEDPFAALSECEHQILDLIVQGMSDNEISVALKLASEIIKDHVSEIFKKLHVANRTQAIVMVIHYRSDHPDEYLRSYLKRSSQHA